MGIARHIALHRAQAEPLGRVVAGVLHPSIVEDQRLGPAAFQEQLAILRAVGRLRSNFSAAASSRWVSNGRKGSDMAAPAGWVGENDPGQFRFG
jgi:hypothetical protein